MYDRYEMYQFVSDITIFASRHHVGCELQFTLGEILERDFEVAEQSGRDNISVCTCTGICLRGNRKKCLPV